MIAMNVAPSRTTPIPTPRSSPAFAGTGDLRVHLRKPHARQREFIVSPAKRKVIRAGRRSGKTTGIAIYAVKQFLQGRRVLYAAPTAEQLGRFWYEVCGSLEEPISAGALYKNETEHTIGMRGTEHRIRAKTAWNADTLRGDYADVLILDEFQLMCEDAWELVGAPMLLDNRGVAIFIYTPPSLRSSGMSKAHDKRYAAKLFARAASDTTGRWAAFHFSSYDNPHISREALAEIVLDMTAVGYRQEIMAEDITEAPGALWKREWLDAGRVTTAPELARLVVGVDPSATSTGDACGIVVAGVTAARPPHLYVLDDMTLQGSPEVWAQQVVAAFNKYHADVVVAEANQGGEMVTAVLQQVQRHLPVRLVRATRGKLVRAEPVSIVYEQGRGHHVGRLQELEDELCQYEPGDPSPNRLDALVWACTELLKPRGVLVGKPRGR